MILTKSDNDVIIKHIYDFNKSVDVGDKMAIDVYINSIEFLDNDDVVFNCIRIKPIVDYSCGITEDTVGKSKKEIGEYLSSKLSDFDREYQNIFKAAIREIKINKFL
jgi:hypothetical protein